MKNFTFDISPNHAASAEDNRPNCAQVSASDTGRFARAAVMRVWAYICALPLRRHELRRQLASLRLLLGGMHECEMADYHEAMRDALMADADWQARVREDLGGEPALTVWESRYEKVQNSHMSDPHIDEAPGQAVNPVLPRLAVHHAPENSGVKTDRDNLFRLAPIRKFSRGHKGAKGHKPRQTAAPQRQTDRAARRKQETKFLPGLTPLRPENLRPFEAAAEIGALTLRELATWREAIAEEQKYWQAKIAATWAGYHFAPFPAKAPP